MLELTRCKFNYLLTYFFCAGARYAIILRCSHA
jgi:hypothetical protein